VLLVTILISAQDQQMRIGEIEFFGASGKDLTTIRASLPIREGDKITFEAAPDAIQRLKQTIVQLLHAEATDVAQVCCDSNGSWMLYIGLPNQTNVGFRYHPVPKGSVQLPQSIVELYKQTMSANMEAVLNGAAAESRTTGYALSTYPALRAKQLATRQFAIRNQALVSRALKFSANAEQRWVAAHVLGYAMLSKQQVAALVWASRDQNATVRNNAVRALAVLAQSSPKTAARIPAFGFVEMIRSGTWGDRNKAAFLMNSLTRPRNTKLLQTLRRGALKSLLEMAHWRSPGHAYDARIILGRIVGIEEQRLEQIVNAGQVDEIFDAFRDE